MSTRTRREMFARLADRGTLVIGTHFAEPVGAENDVTASDLGFRCCPCRTPRGPQASE